MAKGKNMRDTNTKYQSMTFDKRYKLGLGTHFYRFINKKYDWFYAILTEKTLLHTFIVLFYYLDVV